MVTPLAKGDIDLRYLLGVEFPMGVVVGYNGGGVLVKVGPAAPWDARQYTLKDLTKPVAAAKKITYLAVLIHGKPHLEVGVTTFPTKVYGVPGDEVGECINNAIDPLIGSKWRALPFTKTNNKVITILIRNKYVIWGESRKSNKGTDHVECFRESRQLSNRYSKYKEQEVVKLTGVLIFNKPYACVCPSGSLIERIDSESTYLHTPNLHIP